MYQRNQSRLLVFAVLILFVLPTIAACGTAGEEGAGGGVPSIALIIAQGGLGDESYNDLAYSGFQRAMDEFDIETQTIESPDPVAEGEQLLRDAADTGFDLVLTLEYTHADPLNRVAQDYPDTLFGIVNIGVDQPNVVSILFKEHEGSFLAGALASMVTTMEGNPKVNPENIIGTIGGTQSPGIDKFLVGYEEGAHYVDSDTEVLRSYAGSFGDPAQGKELALSMYDQGADIVFQVAGGTGQGVISAAEEAERYAIGVDSNQDDIAPGYVLTSMMKRVDNAVYDVISRLVDDDLEGGTTLEYGLEENGVGLTPMEYTKDEIPQEFLDRVDELRQQIIDGEITVTDVTQE